jgi:uncharacterized protein YndB with AHSA1/START domain
MSRSLSVTTPTELEIEMSRAFDAPRRLVFAALTTPELLRRWHYGPDGWSLVTCEIDLRAGGAYRYVWRGPDGTGMTARGVFREVVAPERIVNTESFDEAWYIGQALVTAVLAEREGGTTLTTTLRYESREARDMALRSGMEDGVAAGYDRLAGALPGMADDHSGTA